MRNARLVLLALALAAVVAGCGSSSNSSSSGSSGSGSGSTGTQTATTPKPAAKEKSKPAAQPVASTSKNLTEKPKIPPQPKPAPSTLVAQDIVKGDGPVAKPGDTVTVQYVGVLYDNGKQFDASWDRGQPFSFPLGAGQVIPGWDRGVAGMRVGGRRQLTIPPSLGYGASGTPDGTIPPNATLVFVVDLRKVTH
jgi:peptidylprolyl isomerase